MRVMHLLMGRRYDVDAVSFVYTRDCQLCFTAILKNHRRLCVGVGWIYSKERVKKYVPFAYSITQHNENLYSPYNGSNIKLKKNLTNA